MMEEGRIYSAFLDRYGRRAEDEVLLPLCRAACLEVDELASEKAGSRDVRLISLGAAMVNHRLLLRTLFEGDGVNSFKAGDVSVTADMTAAVDAAEKELERARAEASPLLKDNGFCFRGVRI